MHKSNELFLNILPKEQRNFPAAAGEFRCHSLHSAQILTQSDALRGYNEGFVINAG